MTDNPCQWLNPKKLLKIKNFTVFAIEVVLIILFLLGFQTCKSSRAKLKIQCPQGRAGSTPAAGIVCLKSPIM